VKRFIAQNSEDSLQHPANLKPTKAAIIGAGLSGLSCGYFLALAGFDVNIYESKDKPGGMAAGAIPSFRLTDEAFNNDLKRIEEAGVKIYYNTSIDKKRFEKLKSENQYLYIAAGAQSVRKLHIAGCEADGIFDPLEFLFELKKGKSINLGKNIAVIGGGNTAIDVARTALRVSGEGGKVTIIYRRSIKEMPADQDEIKAVLDEGVKIFELVDPVKINTKDNKVNSLTLVKMRLEGKDSSGRPKPIKITNSEFDINFDTVIPAIGQDQDFDFLEGKIEQSEKDKYQTVYENVFIGGDALRGASTAINAVGDGRKTAEKIINKANVDFNIALPDNRKEKSLTEHLVNRAQRIFPVRVNETSILERNNFSLITETLTKSKAIEESSRCLACDELCNICTSVCPNLAFFSYQIVPVRYNLQKIIIEDNNHKIIEDRIFEINQKYQILHIADWCNECGNCTTFCPTSGSPYKDKPHLYLNKNSFDMDSDGCYLEKTNNKTILFCKERGKLSSLFLDKNYYIYETKEFLVKFKKETFRIIDVNIKEKKIIKISLQKAAEMSIILKGAESIILNTNNQ
ncbi:MAG: FAD-dependent oxidoreductase, partial [Bacteroidales bacterium]|nr:FAD-dependent oxidoreductase [Bacteroidales bacterium]